MKLAQTIHTFDVPLEYRGPSRRDLEHASWYGDEWAAAHQLRVQKITIAGFLEHLFQNEEIVDNDPIFIKIDTQALTHLNGVYRVSRSVIDHGDGTVTIRILRAA